MSRVNIYRDIISLCGGFSRKTSDIIEVVEGEVSIIGRKNFEVEHLTAPSILVADFIREDKNTNSIYVRVVRQVCKGASREDISTCTAVRRPAGSGIRKVLRDLAVENHHYVPGYGDIEAIPFPTDWANPGPNQKTYVMKTPGGFEPLLPKEWVAVDIGNPKLPRSKTSWAVVTSGDLRAVMDENYPDAERKFCEDPEEVHEPEKGGN